MATEVIQQSSADIMETKVENEETDISKKNISSTATANAERSTNSGSKKNNKNHHGDKKRDNHHHHRRKPSKKKRKWKPYSKMTWEEKKAVEEREKLRADRVRGEMLDRGRPVAPYNTTQFIMAEHDPYEEDSVLDSGYRGNDSSNQGFNDDDMDEAIEAEYTDSPHMAPEFISQDFSEAYERVQEESLSIMTRDDLVKEHLSLERNLSYLQGKLAEEKNINNSYSIKVENLEEELEKLRKDNERLIRENNRLLYGNDADENVDAAVYQTSDFEYEVPTSDQDAIKFSEDYNDVVEQSNETRCRDKNATKENHSPETLSSFPAQGSQTNHQDRRRCSDDSKKQDTLDETDCSKEETSVSPKARKKENDDGSSSPSEGFY